MRPYMARIVVELPLVCHTDHEAALLGERIQHTLERTAKGIRSTATAHLEAVRDASGQDVHERVVTEATARDGG